MYHTNPTDPTMPKVDVTNDDEAKAMIAWVFRAQPDILPPLNGIYDCHVGMGKSPKEAMLATFEAYTNSGKETV